jgi:Zinc dependent phospholipase C
MRRLFAISALLLLSGALIDLRAYSVLAHEAVIDSVWDMKIRPMLLQRFPKATKDELHQAQAFAYGGAIIQDLGYYPHGSRRFSDLVHYVRSGDFVLALLRDSKDLNEYAFALGALAHYACDNNGHRIAVNRAVPILYPKLERKFGDVVTYEDKPSAHLKTEFGFDVLEVAKGNFAPESYHNFIGFAVATPLLERAFQDTYSIPLRSVFGDLDNAIGSYRFTVSSTIPKATRIAWTLKQDEIKRSQPGITRQKFLYNLSGANYEKEWGRNYQKPTVGDKVLAFIIRIIPKIGPLSALTFHTPTPQTETMFEASFNNSLDVYKHLLDEQRAGRLKLSNVNLDTGDDTIPGRYFMADQAYAYLLDDAAKDQFKMISNDLRIDILNYYQNPAAPNAAKKKAKDWARLAKELDELKSSRPAQEAAATSNERN